MTTRSSLLVDSFRGKAGVTHLVLMVDLQSVLMQNHVELMNV